MKAKTAITVTLVPLVLAVLLVNSAGPNLYKYRLVTMQGIVTASDFVGKFGFFQTSDAGTQAAPEHN